MSEAGAKALECALNAFVVLLTFLFLTTGIRLLIEYALCPCIKQYFNAEKEKKEANIAVYYIEMQFAKHSLNAYVCLVSSVTLITVGVLWKGSIAEAMPEPEYLYDRTVCTGLGDRIGALMTLATLSRMYYKTIYFKWCEDPSEIYTSQHRYMPHWYGFDYNLTEFKERFWGFAEKNGIRVMIINITQAKQMESQKMKSVKFIGNEIPAHEGLDHIYTTSFKTTQIYDFQDGPNFVANYRWVSRMFLLYAMINNADIVERKPSRYIVLHMRGFDMNTYTPYETCHDNAELYCTGEVIKQVVKQMPNASMPILAISNNISWASDLIRHSKIKLLENTSEYDDFGLLMGAAGIIQHANFGWSSYSNNPAMIAGIPLISTYKEDKPNHRFVFFQQHGQVPQEFYGCRNTEAFIRKLLSRLKS